MLSRLYTSSPIETRKQIRIGFLPQLDAAPLVAAHKLGLFRKFGIEVELRLEIGSATIRDKIIHGELEAGQADAAMPLTLNAGAGNIACECLTGIVLSSQSSAVIVSKRLWDRGVRDGKSFRDEIMRSRTTKVHTFGVAFQFASANFLLRHWLQSAGLEIDRHVRIATVPLSQTLQHLKSGHLEGFAGGEPWTSNALEDEVGCCIATMADVFPQVPETALVVRSEFADAQREQHLKLIAALIEACSFCESPQNHSVMVDTLSKHLGAPRDALKGNFSAVGPTRTGPQAVGLIFDRGGSCEPSGDKAAWVLRQLAAVGALNESLVTHGELIRRAFRPDLFQQAKQLISHPTTHENEFNTACCSTL